MSTKLYVGNLSFSTEEEKLRSLFSEYGEVVSVNIVTDRETGRSRGFGFVEMSDSESAKQAEQALNGNEFDGRPLKVNEAKPRAEGGGGRARGRRY